MAEVAHDQDTSITTVRFQGDAPVDFARRALDRVRPGLNKVVDKDQAFAHYQILEQPTRCNEFD